MKGGKIKNFNQGTDVTNTSLTVCMPLLLHSWSTVRSIHDVFGGNFDRCSTVIRVKERKHNILTLSAESSFAASMQASVKVLCFSVSVCVCA